LKSCCVLDHYNDERDMTVFLNTTPDLQDQERFCGLRPVDGLRPHLWTATAWCANTEAGITSADSYC